MIIRSQTMTRFARQLKFWLTVILSLSLAAWLSPAALAAAYEIEDVSAAPNENLNVTETLSFEGAAGYQVPIVVPPGRNGLQPNLALIYGSSQRNGIIGVGWRLELGAIQRATRLGLCYSCSDFVVLTGGESIELSQRSGSLYGAKIEGEFTQYHNNGSAGWRAVTREGISYSYGTTTASRMATSAGIFKWLLDRVEDSNGNFMTITYFRDTSGGQLYPERIDYTDSSSGPAGPAHWIQFVRQARSDTIVDCTSGAVIKTAYRISAIKAYSDAQPSIAVREYRITYGQSPGSGRSRINRISIIGADGQSQLPPIDFDYSQGTDGRFEAPVAIGLGYTAGLKYHYLDINADGLTDLVSYSSSLEAGYLTVSTRFSKGDGTFATPLTVNLPCTGGNEASVQFARLNRDASDDLLVTILMDGSLRAKSVFLGNGDGTFTQNNAFISSSIDFSGFNHGLDVNNDGLTDLIYVAGNDENTSDLHLSTRISNGNGTFQSAVAETLTPPCTPATYCSFSGFADANGDGLADVIFTDRQMRKSAYLSAGNGQFGIDEFLPTTDSAYFIPAGDLNGDGLTDQVRLSYLSSDLSGSSADLNIVTRLAAGDGGFQGQVTDSLHLGIGQINAVKFVELNGDGIADLLIQTQSGHEDHPTYRTYIAYGYRQGAADLLTGIDDGHGRVDIAYDYARLSEKVLPEPLCIYRVASLTKHDGLAVAAKKSYKVAGARYNDGQREFRGFAKIIRRNLNLDGTVYSVLETSFHQDTFRKGRPYEELLKTSESGSVLVKNTLSWQSIAETAAYGFVKLNRQRSEFENNASLYSQTDFAYSSTHGLPLTETQSGYGAETITTLHAYQDCGDWTFRPTEERITGETSGIVRRTLFAHDTRGNPTRITTDLASGSDPVETNEYDIYGNLYRSFDANGNPPTVYDYEPASQTYPEKITNPAGHITLQDWDLRFGRIASATDANGRATDYRYDPFGRIQEVDYPDGGRMTRTYTDNTSPRSVRTNVYETASSVMSDWQYFDGLGRRVQSVKHGEAGQFVVSRSFYDAHGRLYVSQGPFLSTGYSFPQKHPSQYPWSRTDYDQRSRPLSVTSHDGQNGDIVTRYQYSGFSTVIFDPDNQRKDELRDHLGRIIRVAEYADQATLLTRYGYNAASDLTSVTNALGDVTAIVYDRRGLKTAMDDPDMGRWDYTYDKNGNLKTQTDENAVVTSFGYNAIDQMTSKVYSNGDPTVTFVYGGSAANNLVGRLQRATLSDGSVTTAYNSYDTMGRVKSVTRTISGDAARTTAYNYDLSGKLARLTYPGGFYVNYAYHTHSGFLFSATGSDGIIYGELSDYTPDGKPGHIDFGNGADSDYSYDAWTQRLTAISHRNAAGSRIVGRNYAYTAFGDIETISDPVAAKTYSYSYDKLHRLVSETEAGGSLGLTPAIIELSYGDSSHLHAATDIAVNNAASKFINYDGNGNMIYGWDASNPQNLTSRTIDYNAENMPVQISAASGSTVFTYDENGKRVKKSGPAGTTYSVGEHFEVINGTATCYIFAGNLRIAEKKGNEIRYYHKDHLGSTAAVTDQDGNTLATMAYLPYGGKRGAADISQTGYKFTDQEWDGETGLYNYDARLYDPVVGRFVSADSIVPKWYDPQSLNRYAYARNNPMMYVDPDGHVAFLAVLIGAGLAYAADAFLTPDIANDPMDASDPLGKTSGLEHAGSLVTGAGLGAAAAGGFRALAHEVAEEAISEVTGGLNDLAKVAKNATDFAKRTQEVGSGWFHRASKKAFPDMAPGKGRGLGAKAPEQVTPGIRKLEGQYVDDLGRAQPWETHYDEFGRQIERTDWNAGNPTQNIPDIHYHTKEFGPNSYNHGPTRVDHAEGVGPLSQ
jgi:RHS repeat-associated protein